MISFIDLNTKIEKLVPDDKYSIDQDPVERDFLIKLREELKNYNLKTFYLESIITGEKDANFFWINDKHDKGICVLITTMRYYNSGEWTIRFKNFNGKIIARGDFYKDVFKRFSPEQFAKLCYKLKQIAIKEIV